MKYSTWIIINSLFLWLIYTASHSEFALGMLTAFTTIYFLVATEILKLENLSDENLPNIYLDIGYDIFATGTFLFFGFWTLGLVYALGSAIQLIIDKKRQTTANDGKVRKYEELS